MCCVLLFIQFVAAGFLSGPAYYLVMRLYSEMKIQREIILELVLLFVRHQKQIGANLNDKAIGPFQVTNQKVIH